jgi:antitoxin PrlF
MKLIYLVMANRRQAVHSVPAKVTESGALQLPAELRKAVGLDRGGDVIVELHGREIRVLTVEDVVARSQEIVRQFFKGKRKPTVDEFLAERRKESERE